VSIVVVADAVPAATVAAYHVNPPAPSGLRMDPSTTAGMTPGMHLQQLLPASRCRGDQHVHLPDNHGQLTGDDRHPCTEPIRDRTAQDTPSPKEPGLVG
jgi:hypothetical protein